MLTAVFLPNRVRNHCQMGMVNVAESWGYTVEGLSHELLLPFLNFEDIPSLAERYS